MPETKTATAVIHDNGMLTERTFYCCEVNTILLGSILQNSAFFIFLS